MPHAAILPYCYPFAGLSQLLLTLLFGRSGFDAARRFLMCASHLPVPCDIGLTVALLTGRLGGVALRGSLGLRRSEQRRRNQRSRHQEGDPRHHPFASVSATFIRLARHAGKAAANVATASATIAMTPSPGASSVAVTVKARDCASQ